MSGSAGQIVVFDPVAWALQYPQFSNVNSTQAQMFFNLAQRYCDNSLSSPVIDGSVGGERETYLYLLTAHIAQLFAGTSAAAATGAVGRVAGATKGSVSVTLELPAPTSPLAGWLQQTQYGLMFYTMTEQYRLGGIYIPGPLPNYNGNTPFPQGGLSLTYPFLPGAVTPWPL